MKQLQFLKNPEIGLIIIQKFIKIFIKRLYTFKPSNNINSSRGKKTLFIGDYNGDKYKVKKEKIKDYNPDKYCKKKKQAQIKIE